MATISIVPIRPSPQKTGVLQPINSSSRPHAQLQQLPRTSSQPRPIVAACSGASSVGQRSTFSSYVSNNVAMGATTPVTVLRRNARERNRVKQVNHGFAALRNHVPGAAKNKKMSKVETLRRAVDYIQALQEVLRDADDDQDTSKHETPMKPVARVTSDLCDNMSVTSGHKNNFCSPLITPSSCCDSLTPTSISSVDSGYRDSSPSPGFFLNGLESTNTSCPLSASSTPYLLSPPVHSMNHLPLTSPITNNFSPSSRSTISNNKNTASSQPQLASTIQSHRHYHHHQQQQQQQNNIIHNMTHLHRSQYRSAAGMTSPGGLSSSMVSPYGGSSSGANSPTPSYGSACDIKVSTPFAATATTVATAEAASSGLDTIDFGDDSVCDALSPQDEELLDAIAWWQSNQ